MIEKLKERKYYYLAAGILLIVALAWSMVLERGEGASLSARLRELGLSISPATLYTAASFEDECISDLFLYDLTAIADASRQVGLNADLFCRGEISIVMSNDIPEGNLMIVLLNGEIELLLIDIEGEAKPISEYF